MLLLFIINLQMGGSTSGTAPVIKANFKRRGFIANTGRMMG